MSRQFNVSTVLRMVPNSLLQQFFAMQGHEEFDPKWSELRRREIEPIVAYVDELPLDSRKAIEGQLRSIFDLACESGIAAILEANAITASRQPLEFPEKLNFYAKSMWAWINHRLAFEKALFLHQTENMPWWRRRNDLPKSEANTSHEARKNLERAISTILKPHGRGRECTVEIIARGRVTYFFAYPDDYVQNVLVHDDSNRLTAGTFLPTFLIVFAFKPSEGSLELCARLPRPTKECLEATFADIILGHELGRFEPDPAYELNHLKYAKTDLWTDPADRLNVRIRKMRLSASGRRVLVELTDESSDNIHRAIRECVNLDHTSLEEWHVTLVNFCIEFLPMDGRKEGRISFDISTPRSCGLRNARAERVELIEKYLKLWKIDVPRVSKALPVAVGA